ncbi:hypothetical protein POTOM_005034 [Populus tomentosa]|uniref:Cyanobacterial aminoacyl-tRNA synthetase CAAD domain-containing protein n=1 Tax=Populus tomentosa TaxID=118781 RepID=A0A8X8AIK9_POPTO|nr:hypothetical protein POTOM_005034 [Populus tomentosa]
MASIYANLPSPPLLVHGKRIPFRTLQKLPLSTIKERQNCVAVAVKATGESSESSTSLSIVKSVQNIVSVNLSLLLFFDFALLVVKMWSARFWFFDIFLIGSKQWDDSEDRLAFVGLGFAALVAVWASANVITAVDKLPVVPSALEFVGILYSSWFVYRYLLLKPNREELFQIIKKSVRDILGQ